MEKRMLYEVETRVYFNSEEEAYGMLPFLKEVLKRKIDFETRIYGEKLFNSGKMLRVSDVINKDVTRVFMGYKEEDLGKLYNIRNEIDEEITNGLENSFILGVIGGSKESVNSTNAVQLFEELGHRHFKTLTGTNLTGYDEKLQIAFKLMRCNELIYPIMLEIEKSAETLEEAFLKELELKKFIQEYKLENRVIKKEPPVLIRENIQ